MTAWRSIDSAPRDGTPILAYGRYGWSGYTKDKIGQAVVVWSDIPTGPPQGPGWKLVNANPYDDVMDATHWKPLDPSPPSEAEGGS